MANNYKVDVDCKNIARFNKRFGTFSTLRVIVTLMPLCMCAPLAINGQLVRDCMRGSQGLRPVDSALQ